MARLTFTDAAVAELAAPPAGRLDVWDAELPGFGLRVSGSGRKSWQLMYRAAGRKRRLNLGGYPALPLALARDAALDALKAIAAGHDPAAERASLTGGTFTFGRFAEAYIERYAKRRKRSWRVDQSMIEQDLLPAWRRRTAESITRRDVIELLERVVQRGHPYAANRRLALIRKMYAWGLEVDLVSASPVIGVRTPVAERPRERVLTDAEVVALWQAWERIGWPFGPLFKLLLLTAQRRGAVAALRLADIALASQTWTLPPVMTGGGQPHEVPLSAFAVEILASQPRLDSAFVFPAKGRPGRPVSGFSKAARRAAAQAGVDDFRVDDLRRTAAIGMARLGTAPHLIGRILNPGGGPGTLAGLTQAEAQLAEKRRALEAWSEHVQQLIEAGGGLLAPLDR